MVRSGLDLDWGDPFRQESDRRSVLYLRRELICYIDFIFFIRPIHGSLRIGPSWGADQDWTQLEKGLLVRRPTITNG